MPYQFQPREKCGSFCTCLDMKPERNGYIPSCPSCKAAIKRGQEELDAAREREERLIPIWALPHYAAQVPRRES